jgi:hypothetical protein
VDKILGILSAVNEVRANACFKLAKVKLHLLSLTKESVGEQLDESIKLLKEYILLQ